MDDQKKQQAAVATAALPPVAACPVATLSVEEARTLRKVVEGFRRFLVKMNPDRFYNCLVPGRHAGVLPAACGAR